MNYISLYSQWDAIATRKTDFCPRQEILRTDDKWNLEDALLDQWRQTL